MADDIKKNETLAQWAARVAPTFTTQWWEVIGFTVDHPDKPECILGGRLYTVGEQRALLAFRATSGESDS